MSIWIGYRSTIQFSLLMFGATNSVAFIFYYAKFYSMYRDYEEQKKAQSRPPLTDTHDGGN